jgi:hypothetical protein
MTNITQHHPLTLHSCPYCSREVVFDSSTNQLQRIQDMGETKGKAEIRPSGLVVIHAGK